MNVTVFKAPELKLIDECQNKLFSIDDKNDIKDRLILLYIYNLPEFQMHGYKVGMTSCKMNETFWHAIHNRISEQENELHLTDEEYEEYGYKRQVVFWGICLKDTDTDFQDHTIHNKIKSAIPGIVENKYEWFYSDKLTLNKLEKIFFDYRDSDEPPYEIYTPRKEQQDAINCMVDYFSHDPIEKKYLLNCKMRFGKCFTVYKYAEETKQQKILILTFVPAVENEWRDNLRHIKTRYEYITDEELKKQAFRLNNNPETPYVVFLSLQNYLGKDSESRETKDKIRKLTEIDFDLLILDEYHFGAWNNRTQETIEDFDKTYQKNLENEKNQLDIAAKFNIKVKETICLSGTPYKVLDRGEFTDKNTFSYSYFDEQKNKYPYSEFDDFETIDDKYKQFPDMEIYGYNIANMFGGMGTEFIKEDKIIGKRSFFSLNELFKTDNSGKLVYEEQVRILLDVMSGAKKEDDYIFPYQYQNDINVKNSLWLMPTVDACCAMAKLLENDSFFGRYEIINISDPSVGAGTQAREYLDKEMLAGKQKGKNGSITLTVNKLTLGVTVAEWNAAFVLKDLASPEQYFQSIFRIQNPLLDEEGNVLKKKCMVYDFNVDRAAALLLKYTEESNEGQNAKLELAKLIVKYLPIYLNGKINEKIGVEVFYELARYGDPSGRPLSERATDTTRTTHLDDQIISDMVNDPECSAVIKKVFAHKKFGKTSKNPHAVEGISWHKTKEYKKGLDVGYKEGTNEYLNFLELDDAQDLLDTSIKNLQDNTLPSGYKDEQIKWYCDGIADGFYRGINAPVKKMKCGEADGIKFADEIRKKMGKNVQYNDNTKVKIKNIITMYLNDEKNIPIEYKGQIYRKWYCDSFKNAAIDQLKPAKLEKGEIGTEDVNNVLRHILARLFQFLYISVYRETTFEEIFNQASPDVFLAAVGIKKDEFQILNKYHVFQEQILDSYIHEFFVNETLGNTMTKEELENENYRNSFNWFDFGLEN